VVKLQQHVAMIYVMLLKPARYASRTVVNAHLTVATELAQFMKTLITVLRTVDIRSLIVAMGYVHVLKVAITVLKIVGSVSPRGNKSSISRCLLQTSL
jgi:hypothetical protein